MKKRENNRTANNYYVWKLYANIHNNKNLLRKNVRRGCLLSSKNYRAKTNFAQHFLIAEQKSLSDKKRFNPFYAAMELSCCFYERL